MQRLVALLLEVEEDRRSKLVVLRVVRVPTTSTWIVTSARCLLVENGLQICKSCEQGEAQRKRGEKGQERARHHGTVPRGCMRSIECVRFKVRPLRRSAARESARGGLREFSLVVCLQLNRHKRRRRETEPPKRKGNSMKMKT